jgi:predicted ATPase
VITALHLGNFKCFQNLDLPLNKLTLLTGFNAAGKSTVLQTILLLAQTLRTESRSGRLRLNGQLVRLGSPGDVINQKQAGTNLTLGVEIEELDVRWSFRVDDDEDRRSLKVESIIVRTAEGSKSLECAGGLVGLLPPTPEAGPALALVDLVAKAVFVSAVRQTDTEVYPVPDDPKPVNANVGSFGEYAAWWLHQFDDLDIEAARCLQGSNAPRTLRGQVNAWAGEFFPGAEVNAQPIPETGLMRLQLRTSRTDNWRRPSNIGYGLTYAFPVLVAGLCAAPAQLVIVDSPEAHLHPRGQSRMGCFLAQAAAGGQILLETHSDHVLNGIRLAVRGGLIAPADVSIYFFDCYTADQSQSQVVRLLVDKNGNLDHWPAGFFDQSEKDLANLAGWE